MNEQVLLSHVVSILGDIPPQGRADAALRHYLADSPRRLGSADKRAVTRAVFAYFRWLGWLEAAGTPPVRVRQALALQEKFDRDPASVKAEALAARAIPDWLAAEMDLPAGFLRQLQKDPVLWIRARLGARAKLVNAPGLGRTSPAALPPHLTDSPVPGALPLLTALRCEGAADLFRNALFQEGAFEIQDLASQLVSLACAPRSGESWWDVCAGEGGKTLHLSDLMGNTGVVWATDRSEKRLDVLKRRAARAGVFNYRVAPWDGAGRPPVRTVFDGILVDAPCTGVGTWRRNPHARWSVTPEDVRELAAIQLGLLGRVASAVKPGGRLVYSVCTLTRSETEGVADAFTAAHPEFEPASLPLTKEAAAAKGAAGPARLLLRPEELDANGMYLAAWRKKKN